MVKMLYNSSLAEILSPRINLLKKETPMGKVYYTGLDIHKKTISYCIKLQDGKIVS